MMLINFAPYEYFALASCLHLLDAGNIIFYISTLQQDAVLPSIISTK